MKHLDDKSVYDKEIIEADWVPENKISEYIKYNEYLDIANEIITIAILIISSNRRPLSSSNAFFLPPFEKL